MFRCFSVVYVFILCLTYKLRCSEDVFELNPGFNLVGKTEINEFDSGQRHILVQQHNVFWLQTREREKFKMFEKRLPK